LNKPTGLRVAAIEANLELIASGGLDRSSSDFRRTFVQIASRGGEALTDVVRTHLADYYGMISHHDACLGRVLTALRETGQEENTVVVYVSDHGLALGSHGLLGKQNLYDHSIRVPLILAGPGIPAATRCAALVQPLDLYATVCALAGVSAPAGIDSRNLVPVLANLHAGRESVCSVYMDGQRMVTDGRWKLIVYRVHDTERVQLFDLATDSDECRDLANDPLHPTRREALRARLASWQQASGDRWFRPV
jgi:arylsulfatase A-like enzyme